MTIKLKTKILLLVLFLIPALNLHGQKGKRSYYQLKIYNYTTDKQEETLDSFFKDAYLPALHRLGIKDVGVFKPVKQDSVRKVYVFIPFKSLTEFEKLEQSLAGDKQFLSAGKDYIDAPYNDIPYSRFESILLKAFAGMPFYAKPALNGPKKDRIYELRSYEGPAEKYYINKVEMFNKGNEIGIFNRLGFNAVFYGEVLSGSTMPNLMYMTSFENKASRDAHWKAFGGDPEWKVLSAKPEYKNNVSRITTTFLYPTDYSDL